MFAYAVEVHGQLGCGSSHRRLQRGPELLHEQAEKPPDHADVHRPVQQIPSERRTQQVIAGQRGNGGHASNAAFGLICRFCA